jgi:hypothetical protein
LLDLTFENYDIPPTICIVAGIIFLIKNKRLNKFERLVGVVILLNVLVDSTAYFLMHIKRESNYLYNFIIPIEKVLTLLIYDKVGQRKKERLPIQIGILAIVLIYCVGYFKDGATGSFHYTSNILTSLIVAAYSYLFLRSNAIGKKGASQLITLFAAANFMYHTISVSAMSARPIARQISNQFESILYAVNLVAFALWSIILLIAILWKRKI